MYSLRQSRSFSRWLKSSLNSLTFLYFSCREFLRLYTLPNLNFSSSLSVPTIPEVCTRFGELSCLTSSSRSVFWPLSSSLLVPYSFSSLLTTIELCLLCNGNCIVSGWEPLSFINALLIACGELLFSCFCFAILAIIVWYLMSLSSITGSVVSITWRSFLISSLPNSRKVWGRRSLNWSMLWVSYLVVFLMDCSLVGSGGPKILWISFVS